MTADIKIKKTYTFYLTNPSDLTKLPLSDSPIILGNLIYRKLFTHSTKCISHLLFLIAVYLYCFVNECSGSFTTACVYVLRELAST